MTLQNTFSGRAGEYWVAAHLLLRGFNAMPLAVDSGVDLLAHRITPSGESLLYQIQVKTTQRTTATFAISRQKLESYWKQVVNLVVVFWKVDAEPQALILPPSLLYMMTSGGFHDQDAPLRYVENTFHIRLVWDEPNRVFVRNRQHEFTAMRNQFDRLEDTGTDVYSIPDYAEWSGTPRALIQFPE